MCPRHLIEARASTWLGIAAVAAIGFAVAAALVPIGFRMGEAGSSGATPVFSPYLWSVIAFTVWQAALSTILSVGVGGLTGLALARAGDFPGRRWLLLLFVVPLAVPALVAVIGIIAIYGENGLLTRAAAALGFERPGTIYGLQGILITHVLFNLPLVARFVVAALDAIPEESWRLADMLALPAGARFRHIEWPVLMRVLPGASSLVFLLCLTSFAVALTLGGGPQATTLEVALYQALRFDLDFALAAKLALIELAIAALALLALGSTGQTMLFGETLGRARRRPAAMSWWEVVVIVLATAFVAAPLIAIVVEGLTALTPALLADRALWAAMATSLLVAVAAGVLALGLGGAIAAALAAARLGPNGRLRHRLPLSAFASLTLVLPPMLLGAGWFLLVLPLGDPARFAASAVVVADALMAVPFVVQVLEGPIGRCREQHDRLAVSLGIGRRDRLRLIDGPVLAPSLATAGLLAMLVSLGDFGTIALFGNETFVTLPALLHQRMGNYRSDDAAAIALVLLALALVLGVIAGWLDRGRRQ